MLENPRSGSHGHSFKADSNFLAEDTVADLTSDVSVRLQGGADRRAHAPSPDPHISAPSTVSVDSDFVQALLDASLSEERRAFVLVLVRMRAASITDRQIADDYLPAVARLLGVGWCDDSRSFAQVTIGVARLQQLLPQLGQEWRAESAPPFDAPAVLLVVGEAVDHSFGAKILAGQLRRHGVFVRLALGVTPADIRAIMATAQFDAVMVSASVCDRVDGLRDLVTAAKETGGPALPVVIGGTIATLNLDLTALTGADLVTMDIQAAMAHCGLPACLSAQAAISQRGAMPQKKSA